MIVQSLLRNSALQNLSKVGWSNLYQSKTPQNLKKFIRNFQNTARSLSRTTKKNFGQMLICGSGLIGVNVKNFGRIQSAHCAEAFVEDVNVQKKRPSKKSTFRLICEFIRKYIFPQLFPLLLAIASAFGAAYINIQIPKLLGELVNILSSQINTHVTFSDYVQIFQEPASKLLLYYLSQGSLTFLCISFLSNAGERIACELRKDLFSSLLRQDISFYDEHKTGELIDRLTSDVQDFKSSFKVCVSQGLRSVSQTVGCVISLYDISPKLTLLMVGVIPILVFMGAIIGASLRHFSRSAQDQMAFANSYANEALGNIRTVRAFAMEDTEFECYAKEIEKAKGLSQALGVGIGAFQGLTNVALNGIVLGMIYCGGFLVSSHGLQPGELMSFLVASQMVQRSLAAISVLFGSAIRGASAAGRVLEYINLKPDMNLTGGKKIPHYALMGEVEFHNVRFSYPSRPESIVLNNVTFKIQPCRVIALCGLSGSGKSTIASLIERFYDPTHGRITLDGHDIRDLDPSWLRERVIGYINQEPILFNTTIIENIRYGKPNATDEEIIEAAKLANADDFIEKFPDGYNTIVGERGASLSGGQKQRIAIARALIKNPAILILDEATSALDAESERLVQEALDRVMVGRTVLVIAHRLSTIQNADIIAVVSNGRITEMGSHFELMRLGGIYRELTRRQAVLR